MLKKLRIQNFKGWADTGTIDMAPITLFFGTNSSGKSSIGQFLMMLKQTAESSDRKAVLNPGGKNSAVQLGSYTDMVIHHDTKKHICFSYAWNIPSPFSHAGSPSKTRPLDKRDITWLYKTVAFSAEIRGANEKHLAPALERFEYTLGDETGNEVKTIGIEGDRIIPVGMPNTEKRYTIHHPNGFLGGTTAPYHFYGFPTNILTDDEDVELVHAINLEHENILQSIGYLGPLRTKTNRLYSWIGNEPESVGYSGENTIPAILAARDRKISLGYQQRPKPFEEIIALMLKKMGLIEDFKIRPISKQRQEYEVKVRIKNSEDFVDLPDVGFGVSQVLPVIVQCFYAPPGSIILMEQPEIHLHPSAQSALADVLICAINAKENGKKRNIQLIVETHSEHFLRRLQRRIAEAENDDLEENVSAYFANTTKSPASLDPLELDEFGNITNWPENFFGDEMGDITAQAKAAMAKRMKRKTKQEDTLDE